MLPAARAATAATPRLTEILLHADLSAEIVRARVALRLMDAGSAASSVRLVSTRLAPSWFELSLSRGAVVSLHVEITPSDGNTEVRLRTQTLWSRYWPVVANMSVIAGGAMACALVVSGAPRREFLDVLVPLLSGMLTFLVIFVPGFWLVTAPRAPAQSRWLLAYARGLLIEAAL